MKVNETTKTKSENWQTLASYLEREGMPVTETEMTVEVYGVYSIPEEWQKLEASGAVDTWPYQTKVCSINLTDGKFNQRELTEEEKKEAENKKKKTTKKEEISQSELERIEKERLEKEEREKIELEEWNALDEQGKFYKKKETPTEECWIGYSEDKKLLTEPKKEESLVELEEEINTDKGTLLEFYKIPPPDEDNKKKSKPKNISPDQIKPIHCVAWLDFTPFHENPGLKEITIRAPLMLKETFERKEEFEEKQNSEKGSSQSMNQEEHSKNEEDNQDIEENLSKINDENNLTDYVMNKQTYIYLRIAFSVPINPPLPEKSIPDPFDLIKKEEKPHKQITASEICSDFRRQLKIAVAAIANQYRDFMGDAKNQLLKRDKGNVLSHAKKEERDSNITKFLYNFNVTGKAELLKEKLKKFIVRIVREKYKKRENVKGIFKNEKDQFYSELYAYLTDEIKLAMDEYVFLKKDELHEHVLSSYEQSRKEVMQYAIRLNKEPEEKRLLRLSKEYEITNDLKKSLHYYKSRLTLNQSKDSWLSYIVLSKKMDMLVDVEEAIVNCISLDQDEINLKIMYAAVKWLKGRTNDAIYFMNAIISKYGIKYTKCNFNAFLAMLYKEKNNELLIKKHLETAWRFKMRELGMIIDKRGAKSKLEKKPTLSDDQKDQIFYNLCSFFNEYYFFEVSEKLLEFIISNSTTKFLLELAKIMLHKCDYDKVISLTDEIISQDKNNYYAWTLRGNAYFFKGNLFDSEESYVKAVRYKPERSEKYDLKMLYRLGITYVKRKTWKDAKTVFLEILKENSGFSFAWKNLGLALMKLEEYTSAEEALNEANLLDVECPDVWAYLCMYSLLVNRKHQALECLNELFKVEFKDKYILEEIGDLFFNKADYQLAADIYNYIIKIDPKGFGVYIKLSEMYFYKFESRKKDSVEILKSSLQFVEEESDKKRITDFIDHLNNQINNYSADINLSYDDKSERLMGADPINQFNEELDDSY